MSKITTGVSAISPEESGMSCAGYYSDTTYVDFTDDGKVAIIKNGDTPFSMPLTGVNFPVDIWGSGSVTLAPGSDPYIIDASMAGSKHEVHGQSEIEFTWSMEPKAAKYKFVVIDNEGHETSTDFVSLEGVKDSSSFVASLKKAIEDAELDYTDVEVSDFSEYTVTLQACVPGKEQSYRIDYYDNENNLLRSDMSKVTRKAVAYDTPRPAFIALLLEYGSKDGKNGSGSGSSCGCKSKCSSSTDDKCNTNLNGSSSSKDSADVQKTIKWTNIDLYERFKDAEDNDFIWDTVGDILIHSGGKNINDDDDNSVKPIVLKNTSDVPVTVKILMAN